MNLRFYSRIIIRSMALMLLMVPSLPAQTISAKVSLQAERILPQDRDVLADLPRQLEDYINNYEWTSEYEDMLVELRINLVIETVNFRNAERIFQGQFLINSKSSNENILDKYMEFPYAEGQFMEHDGPIFNPILSIVDFYIYMILAGELDTYLILGGTFYYDQARKELDEGLNSSYPRGWRQRQEEVNLITDGDHIPLRRAKFYFYEGLYYHEVKQDARRVPAYANKVVELLDRVYQRKPNSSALKRFFDYHHREFCELFSYDEDNRNAMAMVRIDNRHSETYEGCGKTIKRDF